ncbi:MAG: AgmX/PglI C-terminal domain-containing protein [Sandaracinus sp.]
MAPKWLGIWACAVLVACGGAGERAAIDATLGTARSVRGAFTITTVEGAAEATGPVARIPVGSSISVPESALTRVSLDTGPALLLDAGAEVSASEDGVAIRSGRVYVDVLAGDALVAEIAGTSVRASDAALSVEITSEGARLYVVRGEISRRTGDTRSIVRAGEELAIAGTTATAAPRALWNDWTGGLVRTGPSDPRTAPGMGTLEARIPDEVGQARWPLVIRRLDVRVRIVGELAITEVQEVFFNPASETVEGLYRVRVPEGAVLERFAVDRRGQLVDGFVREQAQARADYEAQVYRGSTLDPALLEWDAPGRYRARIYPIQAGELRRIAIRYAEWLPRAYEGGPRLYRYPMAAGAGAPHLGELSFVADVSEAGAASVRAGLGASLEGGQIVLRRSDFSPRADLWLELTPSDDDAQLAYQAPHVPPERAPGSRAVVNEADERDYWYVPLRLPDALFAGDGSSGLDVVVLADVSAATDRAHLELGRSVAEAIAAHLGPNDRVSIVSSDLTIRSVDGAEIALGEASPARIGALLDGLARVPAAGATDLGEAIARAAALLDPARDGAVVYVGDGAPTVGELGAEDLLGHLRDQPHPIRLYAIGVGADANLDLLGELTHGGGLAIRVEERTEAADAAMDVLAHLSRPVIERVTVETGSGIENVFPRAPVDVVRGSILEIAGRVRETPPTELVVRGTFRGQPIEQHVAITTARSDASTDLRLRWAGERLRQQLRDGATREEVAELGTRYGLITPYTSYYVPSSEELGRMGAQSRAFFEHRDLLAPVPLPGDVLARATTARALGPLALLGCALSAEPTPSQGTVAVSAPEAVTQPPEAVAPPPEEARRVGQATAPSPHMARADSDDRVYAREQAETATAEPAPTAPAQAAPVEVAQQGADSTAMGTDPMAALGALMGDEIGGNEGFGGLGLRGTGRGGGGTGEGTIGLGTLGTIGHGAGTGSGSGYGSGAGGFRGRQGGTPSVRTGDAEVRGSLSREVVRRVIRRHVNEVRFCYEQELPQHPDLAGRVLVAFVVNGAGAVQTASVQESTLSNARVETCITSAVRRWTFPAPDGGGVVGVVYPFVLDCEDCSFPAPEVVAEAEAPAPPAPSATPSDAHARAQCGDAADLALADRIPLWRERLRDASWVGGWVEVYRQAGRDCELRTSRDRRAFLEALIDRAGSLSSMIDVYSYLTDASARGFLRGAIFRRVRTPDDLRLVRGAFGTSEVVDWVLVEQVLARATTPTARLRALRGLIAQQPNGFDLRLRLFEELEAQGHVAELHRLAERLRVDPLADAGVRTAIGEMYLRAGREEDARRTFSEIVEFAPHDELARRRLGDLYRAHGWYEDAYRQYETLAVIRPDDPSVLLLLAQAAAGAGRIDEALRLEQRVMGTAPPGAREGHARAAQLWSSVRFAELRQAARNEGDTTRLSALLSRMRTSGVLRGAGALRISLVWEHPDAGVTLWAAHPGRPLARPADLDGELGIEAFEATEAESGTYRVEVRRTTRDRIATAHARLVVVWNEGREDERVETQTIELAPGVRSLAWTIEGTTLASATPTPLPTETPGARPGRRPPG